MSVVSGYPLSVGGFDVSAERNWPVLPPATFAGPIYGASYDDWLANATQDDRAIVVLRDPRDLVVSLVFSLGFSHMPSSMTRLLRSPIAAASDRDRVRIGIFLLTQWADRMRSWGTAALGDREYVAVYRRLIADPKEEFASICRFLGWQIEPRLLHRVVDRHAFEKRTGRSPGDVNPFSHLRKGIDGDWKSYFDRELGEEFEATFPQLLADLGCEPDTDWYKSLPEQLTHEQTKLPSSDARVQELLSKLASFEDQYTELELWRTAAEERREKIRQLTKNVEALEARVAAPNLDTIKHLSQIKELTITVRHHEMLSAERLARNQRLEEAIQELRVRIEERNETAEQRLEQIYELTRKVHELESRIAEPDLDAEKHILQITELTAMIRELETRLAAPNLLAEERLAKIQTLADQVHYHEQMAKERLAKINLMTLMVSELQAQIEQLNAVSEERLADILNLTAHIQSTESVLAEVQKAADDRKEIIEEIRTSVSYRYGFLPVSKLGSLFR
jgi:hypothetical protein